MKAFIAFSKKEITESLRTYKLMIILVCFALFGLISPLTAKMLPELLNGSDLGGMVVQLPESTALDSWMQFFKNIGQLGVLVLVIIFCGIMANEFSRGTLINILTKGIKRRVVILSKFSVAAAIWTLAYCLALAVTFAYTAYFWGVGELPHAVLAFASPWLYGLLLIALLILGGVCFKNFYGSLLVTGGTVVALSLLNIVPQAQSYNPISLSGDTLALLSGQKVPEDFIPALVVCLGLTAALLVVAVALFDKKQL